MHTVFVRHEKSTDPLVRKHAPAAVDTAVYEDRECTKPKGRFTDRRISKNTKTLMLNCYRWRIEWV